MITGLNNQQNRKDACIRIEHERKWPYIVIKFQPLKKLCIQVKCKVVSL